MTVDLSKIEIEVIPVKKKEQAAHIAAIESELRGTVAERRLHVREKARAELSAVEAEIAGRYGVLERSTFETKTREAQLFLSVPPNQAIFDSTIYLRQSATFDKAQSVAEEWLSNAFTVAGVALRVEAARRLLEKRTSDSVRDHGTLDHFEAEFPNILRGING